MEDYICKCNNCGNLICDENPQTGAIPLDILKIDEEIMTMELLSEDGDSYWGCGECQTDGYLEDLDYFQYYYALPKDIAEIITSLIDPDYDQLREAVEKAEKIGYTFNYGMDCVPFDLRKI